MKTKRCGWCHKIVYISQLVKRKDRRTPYKNYCKTCAYKASITWHKRNKDKCRYHQRKWQTKKRYGITWEDKLQMFRNQKGLCAICQKQMNEITSQIDHDHSTKKVRSLLCGLCNKGLGCFHDDIALIEKAKVYLLRQ